VALVGDAGELTSWPGEEVLFTFVRIAACALLIALASRGAVAGEVPDPIFWSSEREFLDQVEGGEFIDRLELHLLQYAADPGWRSEWAAQRHSGNGLFGEYGSTTGTELYVNSGIALNLLAAEWFQLRYDRRDYQEGRFDVSDQRLEALWYAGSWWAFVLSGWPTFRKENASIGAGFRIGPPRSRNALELRAMNERWVWNQKTDSDVRFTGRPVRLLADGSFEAGGWRVHGTIDWGLDYAAVTRGSTDPLAGARTRGWQRFADVEVAYTGRGWVAGAHAKGAALDRSQVDGDGAFHRLDRSWRRIALSLREDLGRWTASGLVGWAWQRDEFAAPAVASGAYVQDTFLVGAEGGRKLGRGLEIRVGYLASLQRAERTLSIAGPLAPKRDDTYLDKAHVRAVYVFGPRMSIEMLLSQALSRGAFGGGSVKALFVL
jgi:hypothetical protein